jgi:hypothetical protein
MIIVSGTVMNESDGEVTDVKIYFSSMEKLDSSLINKGKSIILSLPDNFKPSVIQSIYDIIKANPGDRPVYAEVVIDKHKYSYRFNATAAPRIKEMVDSLIELENFNGS